MGWEWERVELEERNHSELVWLSEILRARIRAVEGGKDTCEDVLLGLGS